VDEAMTYHVALFITNNLSDLLLRTLSFSRSGRKKE